MTEANEQDKAATFECDDSEHQDEEADFHSIPCELALGELKQGWEAFKTEMAGILRNDGMAVVRAFPGAVAEFLDLVEAHRNRPTA